MTKLWIKEQLLSEWFPYWSKEYIREYQHRLSWRWSDVFVPYTYRQALWLDPKPKKTHRTTVRLSDMTKEERANYHKQKSRHYREKRSKYIMELQRTIHQLTQELSKFKTLQ